MLVARTVRRVHLLSTTTRYLGAMISMPTHSCLGAPLAPLSRVTASCVWPLHCAARARRGLPTPRRSTSRGRQHRFQPIRPPHEIAPAAQRTYGAGYREGNFGPTGGPRGLAAILTGAGDGCPSPKGASQGGTTGSSGRMDQPARPVAAAPQTAMQAPRAPGKTPAGRRRKRARACPLGTGFGPLWSARRCYPSVIMHAHVVNDSRLVPRPRPGPDLGVARDLQEYLLISVS